MNEETTQKIDEEEMQRKRNAENQLIEEQDLKVVRNEAEVANAASPMKILHQQCYTEYQSSNKTHPSMHWLGMSRSQDDDAVAKTKTNNVTYRSTHTSPFRVKFRKSHTCGSLFANCNCNSVMTTIENTFEEQTLLNIPNTTPPPCLFSISPPNADVSMSASSLHSTKTTSGIYSLSSAPTSAQLSRDSEDSRSASFDIYATSPTNTTTTTTVRSPSFAHTLTQQSYCEVSQSTTKQVSARQISTPRSSGVTVTVTATDADSETKLTAAEVSDAKCKRQVKRLFQSYSHPDTDFVFTDENKHPLRAQYSESVIKSRSGRVEFKQSKRSSSPNIGQVLDVAVHPDIAIKISPRHSPTNFQTIQTPTRSTEQRRRLLQRTHEIDSNSSTSGSEHSIDLPQPNIDANDNSFDAAQKYFVESGILGPINSTNNLIRKTSKILQDSNVIEQIRKTSIILRANNNNKKTSTVTSPTTPNLNKLETPRVDGSCLPHNTITQSLIRMESMEQPVFYAKSTTNICDYSPTMPTNNSCLIDDDRETLIKNLQGEILSLKDVIKSRDNEITKLRREIHKLKVSQ